VRSLTLDRVRDLSAARTVVLTAMAAAGFAAAIVLLPIVAVVIPFVLLTAFFCARRPAGAIALILLLAGLMGTLPASGGSKPGPIVDLLLAGLVVSVIVTHIVKERRQPWWVLPGVAFVSLYLLITLFEIPTAATFYIGLRSFRFSDWYMLMLPLLALAGWSLSTYVRISRVLIVLALIFGAYAVLRLIIGPSSAERDFALQGAGTYNIVDNKLALIGSFGSRHALAFWATCMTPFCLAAALTQPGKWKLAGAAAVALTVTAVFGTEVRAALPALVASGLTVIILFQASGGVKGRTVGKAFTAVLIVVAVGAGLFSMVVGESSTRYSAILSPSNDTSYQARIDKWSQAVQDLKGAPFGKGLGTAGLVQELHEGPYLTLGSYGIDNSYLKIAYEQGFPIMVLFILAVIVLLVGIARQAFQIADDTVRGISIGAAGTLVAAMSMFITAVYIENLPVLFIWVAVGTAAGSAVAVRSKSAVTEPAPPRAELEGAHRDPIGLPPVAPQPQA
jgi:O-antigen ligase/polysaccharide polymerase Wzy-like membrane protein